MPTMASSCSFPASSSNPYTGTRGATSGHRLPARSRTRRSNSPLLRKELKPVPGQALGEKDVERLIAQLEDDLDRRYEVLVDEIAVDNRPGHPVITGDSKDSRFHAAIFGEDDAALPDVTGDELIQVRRYILRGEGTMPVRKWRELKISPAEAAASHRAAPTAALRQP